MFLFNAGLAVTRGTLEPAAQDARHLDPRHLVSCFFPSMHSVFMAVSVPAACFQIPLATLRATCSA